MSELAPCPFHTKGTTLPVVLDPIHNEIVCVLCGVLRPGLVGPGKPMPVELIATFRLGGLDAVADYIWLGSGLYGRIRGWRGGGRREITPWVEVGHTNLRIVRDADGQ